MQGAYDRGLRPLAGLGEEGGGPQGPVELEACSGAETAAGEDHGRLPLPRQLVLVHPGRAAVVGGPHAVDRREGELGLGAPGLRGALPLVGSSTPKLLEKAGEPGVELGRAGVEAGELPHGERGRGRLDLAYPSEQAVGEGRIPQLLLADLGKQASCHRRLERHEDVAAEQVAELGLEGAQGGEEAVVGCVARGREGVEPGRDPALVLLEGREGLGAERGQDPSHDAQRCQKVAVAGAGGVGRSLGLAEELVVHVLHREPGRAHGEDPDVGRVQVAVAAEAPEDAHGFGAEVAVPQHAELLPRVAPAELGLPAVEGPGQGRHDDGEDLADVSPGVQGEPPAGRVVDEPDPVAHQSLAFTPMRASSIRRRGASVMRLMGTFRAGSRT